MPKFDEEKRYQGEGIIRLKTWIEGDRLVTSSEFDMNNVNTFGAISELKKIIKHLNKDLPHRGFIKKLLNNG